MLYRQMTVISICSVWMAAGIPEGRPVSAILNTPTWNMKGWAKVAGRSRQVLVHRLKVCGEILSIRVIRPTPVPVVPIVLPLHAGKLSNRVCDDGSISLRGESTNYRGDERELKSLDVPFRKWAAMEHCGGQCRAGGLPRPRSLYTNGNTKLNLLRLGMLGANS